MSHETTCVTEPVGDTILAESGPAAEAMGTFPCFGGSCAVLVGGAGPAGSPREAVARARRALLAWHPQFSRFEPASELSLLNGDPRETVPVSAVMGRFVASALRAAERTGGLVDPTLIPEIARVGYRGHLDAAPVLLPETLASAPARAPGGPSRAARWRRVTVDWTVGTVTRPPGVQFDSGGIVKGLFADILSAVLSRHETFAIDAAGDVRFGGRGHCLRPVRVASPFDDSVLHVFDLRRGAAATSGIGKRSWLGEDGRPAHHLLDPATGRPAFTGIVQVTALAPDAVDAEVLTKAALLSGPGHALRWLPHGGVVVYDDGRFDVIEPPEEQSDAN